MWQRARDLRSGATFWVRAAKPESGGCVDVFTREPRITEGSFRTNLRDPVTGRLVMVQAQYTELLSEFAQSVGVEPFPPPEVQAKWDATAPERRSREW